MKKFLTILIFFILIIFISVIASPLFFYFNLKESLLDGLIGGFIGACIVLLTTWIAWKELDEIKNTNSADFIYKLKNDFFKEDTRNLITLIDLDALKFIENGDMPYFEVVKEKLENFPEDIMDRLTQKKFYAAYEIDDFLLGHFEDVGLLEQKGVLDIEMVYEEFSWYIETTYENCEIKKYIEYSRRDEEDKDIYDKLEYIYYKCKSFGKSKIEIRSKVLWKIKWWIKERLKLG
jgi:hypothetical protein